MKKGLLIIISGPSGVGKGTVRKYFMNDDSLRLAYSISMTTRQPREGERDKVDYIFTTREKFEEAIAKGELLEWAEFNGNFYGTKEAYVEKKLNESKTEEESQIISEEVHDSGITAADEILKSARIRSDFILEVVKKFREENIEFAFPSQTIYMAKE